MIRSTPLRLMILHFEQIFFTEGLTFMTVSNRCIVHGAAKRLGCRPLCRANDHSQKSEWFL